MHDEASRAIRFNNIATSPSFGSWQLDIDEDVKIECVSIWAMLNDDLNEFN